MKIYAFEDHYGYYHLIDREDPDPSVIKELASHIQDYIEEQIVWLQEDSIKVREDPKQNFRLKEIAKDISILSQFEKAYAEEDYDALWRIVFFYATHYGAEVLEPRSDIGGYGHINVGTDHWKVGIL